MREIIFRGKRVDNGEWVEGLLWKKKYNTNKLFISYFPDKDDGEDIVVVVPETVGQFTGLTDKNGKKIFEGDIVKVVGMFTTVNGLYKVIWSDASHCYCLQRNSYFYDFFTFSELNGFHEDCEVIGNIHDNKLEDF